MSSNVVTLVMPARSEYLILARLALAGIAREVPMSESVLADLKLAVTEACGNVVRHAYPSDAGVVHVRYEVVDDRIEIEVEDRGGGVPETSRVERHEGDELVESGMGLAIIRAIVDHLEIGARGEDGGTVVRMQKRLLRA
jgi:serine/threonine-protein kinase RsbW